MAAHIHYLISLVDGRISEYLPLTDEEYYKYKRLWEQNK